MKPKAKATIRWLAEALGFFVGLYMLAEFGRSWVPYGDSSPGWYLGWLSLAGTGLLGIGFLAGSIAALRRPKVAGIIFLAFLPATAFCLAYPNAGFLVWHADGSGWFETPVPSTAIGLTALFFLPFAAPLFTLPNKKKAAMVFAGAALVATLVFIRSHWTTALVPRLVGYSVPFLLFGLFWLWTYRRGWPPLLRPRQVGTIRRIGGAAYICVAILVIDVALTLGLSALLSSLWSPDCVGGAPLTRPTRPVPPDSAVFTARAVFVGRSISWFSPTTRNLGAHGGEWAIGIVEERFWGLPSWEPRFVLMTNFIYWRGHTYLIDGVRGRGFLTRFLPIVSAGINCSRSRPIEDAAVDLRLLHEAPPAGGTRLIGYVGKPEPFVSGYGPPIQPNFDSGARIVVIGGDNTRTITTDSAGVYQVDGLPPGDYTLQLEVPHGLTAGYFGDESTVKIHVKRGDSIDRDFDLFWNGRIDGQVKDESGKPARAWIDVLSSNGNQLPGYVRNFVQTNPDGSYEVSKIPPGRYFVVMNPYGPSDESPYGLRYYPVASRPQDAQALEVGSGQKVPDINFVVPQLIRRTIHVHITSPGGKPAEGAWIYIAYTHTEAFQSLANATDSGRRTDRGGNAELDVFGDSHIRVFAETAGTIRASSRYSVPVELDTTRLPADLTLVLSASTLREPSQP
jgi:hypothetical protein